MADPRRRFIRMTIRLLQPLFLTTSLIIGLLVQEVEASWFQRPLVHVFILAGDDNVEGYASLPHLHELATQEATKDRYRHWLEDDGVTWKSRDDVFVYYDHERGKPFLHGNLTVKGFGAHANLFGPEVEFGHVLGEFFDEPVLLIKSAWSGRTLQKDFRPPLGKEPGGFQWFRLLSNIKDAVKHLDTILGPEYKHARYDIKGLVWWHGYSDLEDVVANRNYKDNLTILLTFMRTKIKSGLPILVGELGGQGTVNAMKKELDFREMQKSVVNLARMRRITTYVPTAPYVVQEMDPEAAERDTYQHYSGRADTMMAIGQAMAIAMAEQIMDGVTIARDEMDRAEITTKYRSSHQEIAFLSLALLIGTLAYAVYAIRRGNLPEPGFQRLETLLWGPSKREKRKRRKNRRNNGGEIEIT
ncbi:hypothetical protein FisN_14Hh258 [Fistulifera solaris]|uniref:Sialate O-acetylesterase domain-containing protein n=1 Tax=Fistulifera solaris TaxID=1519565 RepID=A0A1Z5KBB4_FISSO|nr:hypothetical protein FisN_14Hh258 [Fistulifera solaris]|eukprot:GAX23564.1 hypothetical protein FisN_14Hh258 [Fistulifera solaris]